MSTDCDASWTKIYGKSQNNLATNGGTSVTSSFTPTAAQWRSESIDLSAYQGNSHVRFKFKNYNGGGNNIYVDDINVSNAPLAVANTISLQNQLLLFPNPSQGVFTMTLNLASQSDIKISIIDLLGNQVYSSKKSNVKNEDIQFDLSNLAKGVYFVEVATNKEKVTRRISIVD
ncbi:MAG TPA: T9SS type A sorting domain-containing protein [Bacteroidia bacterium]|nr:T9SS type A sorting domain-containing protein [Bacteroidia bacterium]